MKGLKKTIKVLFINLAVLLALLFLIEGFSSLFLTAHHLAVRGPVQERRHTMYDPELGWVNIPNLVIPDMYGGGNCLHTNSRGCRGRKEFENQPPPGKIRLVCSGDSYTLGYGVSDDQTWPARLESLDTRLETVNMGNGGYGVDQAYLWFKRDAADMQHQIHLFAFIIPDFFRMEGKSRDGYGKPYLTVKDGLPFIANHPVPRRGYLAPWVTTAVETGRMLSVVKLANGGLTRMGVGRKDLPETEAPPDRARLALCIFDDLKRLDQEKDSMLVLVCLPLEREYMGVFPLHEAWRELVREWAGREQVVFMDLLEELRKLPPTQVNALYNGHYSPKGNEFIAKALYERLRALPEAGIGVSPNPGDGAPSPPPAAP